MEQEQNKTTQKKLIVGGLIALTLLLSFWYFYRQGKKTTTIAKLPTDDPNTGNQSSGVGDSVISQISTDMYNDMKGLNWGSYHDETPFNSAMTLSDTDFVKLYNFFNTKYQKDSEATLTAWLNGEKAIPYSPFDSVKVVMLSRLGKLNLK